MNVFIQSGYAFRPGAHISKDLNGNAIGKEIAALRDENSRFNNADVVEAARPESSAMHPYFEWDDGKAGDLWREEQARYLVRNIVYVVADPRTEEEHVTTDRAFISMNVTGLDVAQSRQYEMVPVRSGTPQAFRPAATKETRTPLEVPVPNAAITAPKQPEAFVVIAAPPAILKTPERERSLGILRRWADTHSDDPYFAGVVAAIRALD